RVVHVLHLLDVRARREHLLPAVHDHGPYVVTPGRLLGQLLEPVLGGDVQRVHGRAVEPNGADAFGDFEIHGPAGRLTGTNGHWSGAVAHTRPGGPRCSTSHRGP